MQYYCFLSLQVTPTEHGICYSSLTRPVHMHSLSACLAVFSRGWVWNAHSFLDGSRACSGPARRVRRSGVDGGRVAGAHSAYTRPLRGVVGFGAVQISVGGAYSHHFCRRNTRTSKFASARSAPLAVAPPPMCNESPCACLMPAMMPAVSLICRLHTCPRLL